MPPAIASPEELALRARIDDVLLDYALVHITMNHVEWSHLAVSDVRCDCLCTLITD